MKNYNMYLFSNTNTQPLSLLWFPSIGYGETGAIYTFDTKAVLKYDGYIEWFAPTEIHSICKIDINYFPFDEQSCPLRFGSWTYTGKNMCLDGSYFPSSKKTISRHLRLRAVLRTPSQMFRFTLYHEALSLQIASRSSGY